MYRPESLNLNLAIGGAAEVTFNTPLRESTIRNPSPKTHLKTEALHNL